MNRRIVLGVLVGVLALAFLQSASAYVYGNYDSDCKYWDRAELEWKTDPVCSWLEKGDWREEAQRSKAAAWLSDSYDARYNINYGLPSGIAFGGYEEEANSGASWRYKPAYDPRVDNEYVFGKDYYYYQPRYDYQSGTFDWRY